MKRIISFVISIAIVMTIVFDADCFVYANSYKASSLENAKYAGSKYFDQLSSVETTGNYRNDVIAVAHSQLYYHEGNSKSDYDGKNTKGTKDYTEYGRYFGSVGNAWCSEFASWCIRMAGVPLSVVNNSKSANAYNFTKSSKAKYYNWSKTKWAGGKYTPQKGDIILWVWSTFKKKVAYNVSLSHTSILEKVKDNENGTLNLSVVHGNTNGCVKTSSYTLNAKDGKLTNGKGAIGYFVAPDYESASVKKHTITFKTTEGIIKINSKVLAKGGVYGALPLLVIKGRTFLGWYSKQSGGSRICIYTSCNITGNQTLYAKWSKVTVAKTKIKKLKAKKKGLKVTWKKCKGVNGYQIQYSRKKNFKKSKILTIKKASKKSTTIKKLKRKKKYFVRIRTYKTVGGKTYRSAWSKKKKKKTK